MRTKVGLFVLTLFFCGVSLEGSTPAHSTSGGSSVIVKDKSHALSAAGAWASLIGMFAVSSFVTAKMCQDAIEWGLARVPGISSLRQTFIPALIAWTVVAPSSMALYAKYHDLLWYFYFVFYSGTRASITLAVKIISSLGLLVKHLTVLLTVREQLVKYLEQVAAVSQVNSQKFEEQKEELLALFDDAIEQGNAYVRSVYQVLATLGMPVQVVGVIDQPDQEIFIRMRGCWEAISRETTLPLNGVDVSVLDRLARDLIAYWESYLSGLIATIDHDVLMCQEVFAAEQFIATWLNRPIQPPELNIVQPQPHPQPSTVPELDLNADGYRGKESSMRLVIPLSIPGKA